MQHAQHVPQLGPCTGGAESPVGGQLGTSGVLGTHMRPASCGSAAGLSFLAAAGRWLGNQLALFWPASVSPHSSETSTYYEQPFVHGQRRVADGNRSRAMPYASFDQKRGRACSHAASAGGAVQGPSTGWSATNLGLSVASMLSWQFVMNAFVSGLAAAWGLTYGYCFSCLNANTPCTEGAV